MDGPSRKPTFLVQRIHVPNRLAEQALLGVYERLLQVLAQHEEGNKHVTGPALPEPLLLSTTGGPS
jgi:hypothetical protein